jgi:hypothetical protein
MLADEAPRRFCSPQKNELLNFFSSFDSKLFAPIVLTV